MTTPDWVAVATAQLMETDQDPFLAIAWNELSKETTFRAFMAVRKNYQNKTTDLEKRIRELERNKDEEDTCTNKELEKSVSILIRETKQLTSRVKDLEDGECLEDRVEELEKNDYEDLLGRVIDLEDKEEEKKEKVYDDIVKELEDTFVDTHRHQDLCDAYDDLKEQVDILKAEIEKLKKP